MAHARQAGFRKLALGFKKEENIQLMFIKNFTIFM
jgi:hypothetical protein